MKKLLTILLLIMLIISFFQITKMYALYKEKLTSEYNTLLGVWEIKINGKDVTKGGQVVTFDIPSSHLKYVESNVVQAGKIAPGSQAYIDLEIDPSTMNADEENVYTDVSVIYTINLNATAVGDYYTPEGDQTANAKIELVSTENYFKKNKEDEAETPITNETQSTDGNTYIGVIPVNMITQGYKNYVRLYFEWINNELLNEADSNLASIENEKLTVSLNVNLKQYTGEEVGNEP